MNGHPDYSMLPSLAPLQGDFGTLLEALTHAEQDIRALPLTLETTFRYLHILGGVLAQVTNEEEMSQVRDVLTKLPKGRPPRYLPGQEPPVHQMMLEAFQSGYEIMATFAHQNAVFSYLEQIARIMSVPFEKEAMQFLSNLQTIVSTTVAIGYQIQQSTEQSRAKNT
jgi:hypothetical protein